MAATIKDVARAAGVSIGTVSKLINNTGFVSDKIRERVLLAISLLSYQPNALARKLKQSKTNIIGVVVPDISNPYTMEMMKSVEDLATEMGYNLIFCSSKDDTEHEKKALQWLIELRVDGILLLPAGDMPDEISIPKTTPVVLLDRKIKADAEFDVVVHENVQTSAALVRHLLQHGYRKLLFIHGLEENSVERERLQGIQSALAQWPLPAEHQQFLAIDHHLEPEAVRRTIQDYLGQHDRPEAIYATNRLLLAGTIRVLLEMRVSVPENIGVVGFGDIDRYGILRPSLTFAREYPDQLGKLAVELLFERMENDNDGIPKTLWVNPQLIIGTSCGSHH